MKTSRRRNSAGGERSTDGGAAMSGDLPAPPTGQPLMPTPRPDRRRAVRPRPGGAHRDTDAEALRPARFISAVSLPAGVRKTLGFEGGLAPSPLLFSFADAGDARARTASTTSGAAEALIGHARRERDLFRRVDDPRALVGGLAGRMVHGRRRATGPRWTIASGRPTDRDSGWTRPLDRSAREAPWSTVDQPHRRCSIVPGCPRKPEVVGHSFGAGVRSSRRSDRTKIVGPLA